MDRWNEIVYPRIVEAAKEDARNNENLEKVSAAEKKYIEVLQNMQQDQRDAIEEYISAIEELDYQRMRIAYYCGCGMTYEKMKR